MRSPGRDANDASSSSSRDAHKMLFSKCLMRLAMFQQETGDSHERKPAELYHTAIGHLKAVDSTCHDDRLLLRQLSQAHHTLADYSHTQYRLHSEYVESADYKRKTAYKERLATEIKEISEISAEMDADGGDSRATRVLRRRLEQHQQQDVADLEAVCNERYSALDSALSNYLQAMRLDNCFDLDVFRVSRLWLEHADDQLVDVREHVTRLVNAAVDSVASYKWLPVWPQLISRLQHNVGHELNDSLFFKRTLDKLVERTAREHPFHTFYAVHCLAKTPDNGNADKTHRNAAAVNLMGKLTSSTVHMRQMNTLAQAFHTFTKRNELNKDRRGLELTMVPNEDLLKSSNFDRIPLPTMPITIRPDGDYSMIPLISRFESKFVVSQEGVNCPLFMKCLCTDGVSRKCVVKQKDDLRQDAVMQQMFNVANRLFADSPMTTTGQHVDVVVRMRTYTVVPLSPYAGILEFAGGTQSLLNIITNGHAHHNPDGLQPAKAKAKIHELQKPNTQLVKDSSLFKQQLALFRDVCSVMRPVLRHHFYERFPDPQRWFTARTQYTVSTAVASMVGHLVGLGDRHCSNILMDLETAELVHIDLGIGFEAGRQLRIPETVPFRLTREIVDPMGVAAMRVLRADRCRDILVAIVSVLLHDPLSDWTLSETTKRRKQPIGTQQHNVLISPTVARGRGRGRAQAGGPSARRSGALTRAALASTATVSPASVESPAEANESAKNQNLLAERALSRLVDKLNGRELAHEQPMDVPRQVSYLINEARNPQNLCTIFCGWQAYL